MIADFIFNSFLTYTAIILNVVTIFLIHKPSTTAKVVEPFLSDEACGLFGQPFYTSLLVKWLQMENLRCNAYLMLSISGVTFITESPPGRCDAIGVVSAAVGFIPTLIHIPHQDITNCTSHAYLFLCVFSNLLG